MLSISLKRSLATVAAIAGLAIGGSTAIVAADFSYREIATASTDGGPAGARAQDTPSPRPVG
jgi:hypothetical protein